MIILLCKSKCLQFFTVGSLLIFPYCYDCAFPQNDCHHCWEFILIFPYCYDYAFPQNDFVALVGTSSLHPLNLLIVAFAFCLGSGTSYWLLTFTDTMVVMSCFCWIELLFLHCICLFNLNGLCCFLLSFHLNFIRFHLFFFSCFYAIYFACYNVLALQGCISTEGAEFFHSLAIYY